MDFTTSFNIKNRLDWGSYMLLPLLTFLRRSCVVALALWCGLSLFGAPSVLAHNSIDTSTPSDGATLSTSPADWVLSFANDVPLNSASAEIITSDGVRTSLPTPTHGSTQKIIRFALPQNLTGAISARWRLVGTDGHVVSGRVQFTVTSGADTTLPGTTETTTSESDGATPTTIAPIANFSDGTGVNLAPEPVRWVLRLTNYAALLLFGGLLFTEMNLAQGVMQLSASLRLAKASAVALTAVPALQTLIFLSDVNDTSIFGAIAHLGDSFSSTPASMNVMRAISGGVFIYLLAQRTVHHFSERFTQLALINSGVYLIALAYGGHSRSSRAPWLGIPVDVIHTASSAIWLGGLVIFIFLVLPSVDSIRALQAFVRYGHSAQYAVIAIITTGVIQTLRLHGGITTLFTTTHGRVLLLKILCVAAMLKVGDINRRRLLRQLPTSELLADRRRALLVRASTTEAALGGIVVAITTALVTSTFQ